MSKKEGLISSVGGASGQSESSLLQRLLQSFARPAREGEPHAGDSLHPAGRRSGSGVQSIAPYLEAARNTRPSPSG